MLFLNHVFFSRARRAAKEAKEAPAQPAPVSFLKAYLMTFVFLFVLLMGTMNILSVLTKISTHYMSEPD